MSSTRLGPFFVILALLGGRARHEPPRHDGGGPRHRPTAPTANLALALVPTEFRRARIAFDGFADGVTEATDWDVGGAFLQTHSWGEGDRVRIVVRAHPDETLDDFERDHAEHRLSGRSITNVCGRPAAIEHATRDAKLIDCVIVSGGDNHPARLLPEQVVALAFSHGPLRIVFTVAVASEHPSTYTAIVDRILASIHCLP